MRKIFYSIFISIILIITILITLLNSTNILNHTVNKFASAYNISIGDISGNFIYSINIDGIKYQDKEICSSLKVKWSLISTILNDLISISNLTIDNFDINNTLSLVESLEDNSSQKDSNNNLHLYIRDINISIKSYKKDDINIEDGLKADLNRLMVSGNYIKLGRLNIDINRLKYSKNTLKETNLVVNEFLMNTKTNQIDSAFIDLNLSIDDNNISSHTECYKDSCRVLSVIDSIYSKNIILTTRLNMEDNLTYNGELIVEDIGSIPQDYRDIFKSFYIIFKGDLNSFNININSNSIHSNIATQDLKLFNGYLKLDNLPKIPKDKIDYVKNLKIDFSSNLDSFNAKISSKAIKSSINSKDFKNFKIKITKPQIIKIDINKKSDIFNIDIKSKQLSINIDSNLKHTIINNYTIKDKKLKIFSKKSSVIDIKGSDILVKSLWINDELLVKGLYNRDNKIGKFNLKSDKFNVKIPKYINTKLIIDTNISIDGDEISVDGGVELNGGDIKYQINNKPSFVLDEDIIFIKNKKKPTNKFINNLSIELNILTNKSLRYRRKDIRVDTKIYTHLSKKFNKDFELFGQISLERGSRYIFRNKRLIISNSSIHFRGELDQPILDIKALYKNSDYRIRILVSGSHTNPAINFISTPYLSKEGILSILLLDSSGLARNSNSSEDLQYLLGGAVAKSLLSNIGLKVEHFVISASSLEVGKRLGDKIMVIYLKDKVSSVKVVYEHNKNIEADFMINKESSSADIFYKGSY